MAMGVVTREEFLKELAHEGEIQPIKRRGRSPGDSNVPEEIRKEIAETAIEEGRSAALDKAKSLGISASSASAYAKGATSTASYNNPSKSLIEHINKARYKHIKKASHRLGASLDALTPEKLETMRPKDLSGVARDMAAIIKHLEPPPEVSEANRGNQQPQFVVFAPQFRQENSFDVIKLEE